MTMYRWAAQGRTTKGEKLKVIRDTLIDHYYIAEDSVRELSDRYDPVVRFQLV